MFRLLALSIFGAVLLCPVFAPAQDAPKGKNWKGQNLRMRDLSKDNHENSIFDDCKMFLVNMKEVNAKGASFKDADLTSASLDGANLTGAIFTDATLDNASLQGAILHKANLEGVDLSKTSLQRAELQGANLRKLKGISDITKADFRGADLRGANLTAAKDYSGSSAKFKGAKYDKDTKWFQGFDLEGSGAILSTEKDPPAKDPPAKTDPKKDPRDPRDPRADPDPKKDPTDPKTEGEVEGPKGAPSLKVMKGLLENGLWAPPMQGGTKHVYEYKSMKWAPPRKGNAFEDGTPLNRETTVYPVRLVVEVTRNFTDGTSKKETKKQTFVFFKAGDFDEWTYKFISNDK